MYDINIWSYINSDNVIQSKNGYHAGQLDDLTFFNQCIWMDDEESILCGDTDGVIHVWNMKTDDKIMLKSYSRGYPDDFQLSYNRIHRQLATGYQDQVGIWSHFQIKPKPNEIISYQMITRDILDLPDGPEQIIPLLRSSSSFVLIF